MSLRTRTMVGLFVGLIGLTAFLSALFEWNVARSFRTMERELAENRLRLVDKLYLSALEQLSQYAKGLSEWDATLEAVEKRDDDAIVTAYADMSFYPAALEENHLAFAALIDDDGSMVFSRGRLPGERAPEGLDLLLVARSPMNPGRGGVEGRGLVTVGGVPYLAVSQRVVSHESVRGLSRGRLVVARALDGYVLDEIKRLTEFNIAVARGDGADLPPESRALVPPEIRDDIPAACAREPNGKLIVFTSGGRAAGGIGLLDAFTGQPAAALWVRLPPQGAAAANTVRGFFLVALAGAALLVSLGLYAQVEFQLLRPLGAIQRALNAINETGDRAMRVPRVGAAEFVAHADRVNATLDGLRDAEAAVERRLRIEEALAEAARILLRGGPDTLVACLRALGEKLDVDVVSYYAIDPKNPGTMLCAGTFRDPSTRRFGGAYRFTAPVAEWIVEAARTGKPLVVDADDAQNAAGDADVRAFIAEYDLRSFLGMPMAGECADDGTPGGGGGVVGFGVVGRPRVWTADDQRAIAVIAELLEFGLRHAHGADR